jgi:dTDP-glucose 4,6-dehydratase
MKKLLITGAAGFVASHLAEYFVGNDYDVYVADRWSYAGKWRNLEGVLDRIHIMPGDLKSQEFCDRLTLEGFDEVIHAACNTDVDMSIKNPIQFTEDNVLGTNQLLWALSKKNTPEKIVVYSTDEVYGSTPESVAVKEDAPHRPSNAYSASKVGIEGLVHSYLTTNKMPIVVVRPCNTYGQRQHPGKIIPHFVKLATEGKSLTVFEDGKGRRDWLHTLDHAKGIETLLARGVVGEFYNMPAGEEHSCGEIAERITALLGVPYDIEWVTVRPGHDKRYWMDGSKIAELGWKPQESFEERFKETVLWFRDNPDWWKRDAIHGRSVALAKK